MRPTKLPLSIVHYALCIAFAALAAKAITQAEWEADNSLIPTPSASSAFIVAGTEHAAFAGDQTETAAFAGLDSTLSKRVYEFDFETRLSTKPIATVLLVR